MTFRAGDTVKHGPSDQTWVLACDEYDGGYVRPCGWPDGEAETKHLTLVEAASDEARAAMLRQVSKSRRDDGGPSYRAQLAVQQLHSSKLCDATCVYCEADRRNALTAAREEVVKAAQAWDRDRELRRSTDNEVEEALSAAVDRLAALERGREGGDRG